MAPQALAQVLRQIPIIDDENLLVGINTSDDAAVYKINENQAIISTIDFFTPIVDDPYTFGQIAACNALSDVYAMGGRPFLALNIVCCPEDLAEEILPGILLGGFDKVVEAGAIIGGGHSIKNPEPVYGLSVLGKIHPDKILTNSNAKPGDALILTKPIGTGIVSTALKAEMLDSFQEKKHVEIMSTLNKEASEAAVEVGVNSITDITGFGLMGHAYEMASASDVTIKINVKDIPIFPGADDLASMGILPAGLYHNKRYIEGKYYIESSVPENLADIAFDPQTSGGLLISVRQDKVQTLMDTLKAKGVKWAAVIGSVQEPSEYSIVLEN